MIDTIKVLIPADRGITVEKGAHLRLIPKLIDLATGEETVFPLAKLKGGGILEGAKAYYNDPDNGIKLNINGYGAAVQFSLPRVYSEAANIYPVGVESAEIVFKKVRQHLKSIGVYIPDLLAEDTNKISRIDLFRNALTDYPFDRYARVLQGLSGSRVKKREYGGAGFLWHNKSRQVACYNKIKEMEAKGYNIQEFENKNILRAEVRNTKAKVVRSNLPFHDCRGILQNWDTLPLFYRQQLKSIVFKKVDLEQARRMLEMDEIERMKFYEETYAHGGSKYLKTVGARGLLQIFGSLDKVEAAFQEVCQNRETAYRRMKQIKEIIFTTPEIVQDKEITIADLYTELHEKLLEA